ncbi:MAG: Dihydroorotate dehydrogenase B (NAD(+)), electron transfer subunit [Syntrophorhabdaceae bacterium PtaU1.Bin034]|jgi:ferredoxin--NADP+ reductase|nr:MAG: Dihydroorotate dehydrogenase B (NAD(+)), electron transfer subunit [Syntrophorhabdaceae bacterium PtaU1.Bin034]
MNKVLERQMIVPNLHLLTLEAPDIAHKIRPGQFVIVRAEEEGERIPLSVADWDEEKGSVSIVFMEVGASTGALARLSAGDTIPTCVGPLGNATEITNFGTVMCVGGCYGIGSIYPVCNQLKKAGNRVLTVIEARSSFLIYWAKQLAAVSNRIFTITRDGSSGYKGHVSKITDIINSLEKPPDRVIVNGCTFLMNRVSEVTRGLGIPTVVNLNPIMIDGTGMCGVCRVTVGGQTRFACVDGPEFSGHEIDWREFLARRKAYMNEEALFTRKSAPATEAIHKEGKCQS